VNPIPPNTQLNVTLDAQQWNGVLAALSDAPYKVAAPLIQAMTEQLQAQAQMTPTTGNGLDHPAPLPT
jgi:hypothetical protein